MEDTFVIRHRPILNAFEAAYANKDVRVAINQASASGATLPQIIVVIQAQLANILAGNWPAVIAAILALIVSPSPAPTPTPTPTPSPAPAPKPVMPPSKMPLDQVRVDKIAKDIADVVAKDLKE